MNQSAIRQDLELAFDRLRGMDISLTEQLRLVAEAIAKASPEFAAAVDRLLARLRANGAGESAPRIGEPMPPFHLPDESGHIVSLDAVLSKGPVAVTFHRGHWCPYCRININALAAASSRISTAGGQIVAVMPDRRQFTAELKTAGRTPFPILTDLDNGYAMSLNLAIWLGDELRRLMADATDIAEFQGNDSWILPIPATFVVGADGLIKARFIDPDFRKRMTMEDLLRAMAA